MNVEILSIGTEILLGDIVNTNAAFLSRRLAAMGMNLYRQSVVGDNLGRVVAAISESFSRADMIITTGGLGPTEDDLTKEAVAEYFGLKMILDEKSADALRLFFEKLGRPMTENNMRQAYFPEESIIVKNDRGTAPACIVEKDGKVIIVLPGPPREMSYVFENEIEPYLSKFNDSVIKSLTLKMFGIGESKMEDSVKDLIFKYSNPTIAPYAKTGESELRISAKAASEEEASALIKPVESEIRQRLGEFIYGTNSDSLASVLVQKCREKNITFASAESCTGGMISSMITSVAGSSDVFAGGITAYSNDVKTGILRVNPETVEKYGAVSEECAAEMCTGCAQLFSVDAAFAVTGIAGPGGGSVEKPVGTVCFGFYYKGDIQTVKMHFGGDREMVRIRSAMFVLDALRRGADKLC